VPVQARGINHFRSRHDLDYSRLWVSLRSETAFNRTVTVPPVSDEGLDKILEYEAQQQVPFPLDEVYWDRRVIAIRENGEVLATIYAIRKAVVEERVRRVRRTRLPVDGVQLRAVALQNFCAYERLLEPGTIVVDVDFGGLQILIHHDEQTWFRVLPVGGVDLVHAVQDSLNCTYPAAVAMSAGDQKARDPKVLEHWRREVAADIAAEVAGTVRYYLAARPGLVARRVVLFESHPCVPPMAEALQDALGAKVLQPRGFRHIEVDPDVVTAGIQEHFASLARAAGLALQGIGKAEVDIRLFDPERVRRVAARRTGYIVAAALVLLLLGIVTWRHRTNAQSLQREDLALSEALARASNSTEIDHRVAAAKPIEDIAYLARAGEGRARLISIYEHLVARCEAWEGEVPMFIAGVDLPGAAEGEIVLHTPENRPVGELDAALEAFARTLKDGKLVTEVIPGKSWSAASPSIADGGAAATDPLRWRFRHRSYSLKLDRGAAP
jgi:type IV pilus assembly protein PilM